MVHMVVTKLKKQLKDLFSSKSAGSQIRSVSVTNGKIMKPKKR